MIKKITEWGNCSRCRKKITDNTIGDIIEAEEVIVCDSCAKKHRLYIIAEINKFRQSKEFNDRLALRNKILWASESLGNYFDNATGTIIESVSDYDNCNVFELQSDLLNIELDCVNNNLAEGELGIPTKDNPELQALRKDLINQIKKLASYLEK
jgi:DNA-directed RNA polymerase subunit RPC12/RpoP